MTLIRWQKPENALWQEPWSSLRSEINRLFDQEVGDFGRMASLMNAWGPAMDLYENKDSLILKVELPGMKREDIDLCLQDGTLTVSGERKADEAIKNVESHRLERFYGRFQRAMVLPVSVNPDAVKASYTDGVLTVVLPKAEEAKPRQIEVKVN